MAVAGRVAALLFGTPGQRWTSDEHNSDCWGLNVEGVDGT
jgi:hypothetical protein